MSEDADFQGESTVRPCQCCGIERMGYMLVCGCSLRLCPSCDQCDNCCEALKLCDRAVFTPKTTALARRPENIKMAELTPFDQQFLKTLKVRW